MGLVVVDLIAAVLSPREKAVAELLLEAKGDCDIARSLGISARTVKGHLGRMCRKAGLGRDSNRILLVLVLLGTPRLKKNRIRFRPSLVRGFREPHRPVGSSLRMRALRARDAQESQPVGAGCSRMASPPAPGGAVG